MGRCWPWASAGGKRGTGACPVTWGCGKEPCGRSGAEPTSPGGTFADPSTVQGPGEDVREAERGLGHRRPAWEAASLQHGDPLPVPHTRQMLKLLGQEVGEPGWDPQQTELALLQPFRPEGTKSPPPPRQVLHKKLRGALLGAGTPETNTCAWNYDPGPSPLSLWLDGCEAPLHYLFSRDSFVSSFLTQSGTALGGRKNHRQRRRKLPGASWLSTHRVQHSVKTMRRRVKEARQAVRRKAGRMQEHSRSGHWSQRTLESDHDLDVTENKAKHK